MRILLVQESDWIKRNPHQQHHLMELLGRRGHIIHVIDYEIDWNQQENSEYRFKSPRKVFKGYKKVSKKVTNLTLTPAPRPRRAF